MGGWVWPEEAEWERKRPRSSRRTASISGRASPAPDGVRVPESSVRSVPVDRSSPVDEAVRSVVGGDSTASTGTVGVGAEGLGLGGAGPERRPASSATGHSASLASLGSLRAMTEGGEAGGEAAQRQDEAGQDARRRPVAPVGLRRPRPRLRRRRQSPAARPPRPRPAQQLPPLHHRSIFVVPLSLGVMIGFVRS